MAGGSSHIRIYYLSETKDDLVLRSSVQYMLVDRPDHAEMVPMLTSAVVRLLEGHESDECDCPACLPTCERSGRKCFIVCNRCRAKVEADDVGPLKSVTKPVHYLSTPVKGKILEVSPEHRELMHLLKTMDAQAEAAGTSPRSRALDLET
jgi:hypothetical protein